MRPNSPFYLVHDTARRMACQAVNAAEQGMVVTIRKPNRTLDQNAKFHAAVDDIAKARPEWNGLRMDADDWKALLILSHAIATGGEGGSLRLVPDLEGKGFVQLRESSARMSDLLCLQLCDWHHTIGPAALHRTGDEAAWWRSQGVDPYGVILSNLAGCRDPNRDEAIAFVKIHRERAVA